MTILLLTNREDEHSDWVARELNERGLPFFRLNTETLLTDGRMAASFEQDEGWNFEIGLDGRHLNSREITSVLYRRPLPPAPVGPLSRPAARYVTEETHAALGGLVRVLDARWVSHPERIVTAGYKPLQMHLAHALGLVVPPTLITTDPDEAQAFVAAQPGPVIWKSLSGPLVGLGTTNPQGLFTAVVPKDDPAVFGRVKHNPNLFQSYVPKRCEYRVTVVGSRCFTVEIDSQAHEQSTIDFRLGYDYVSYRPGGLEERLEQTLVALVRQLGLAYGAIDLIRTPSGEVYFLEVNPVGQWNWLEDETGLPITAAIVDELASPWTASPGAGVLHE